MFRCNLQDLGSVISGDLEVLFFKSLRLRKAFNRCPPNSNIASRLHFLEAADALGSTMALLEDGPNINFLQKAVPLTPPDMIIH